eukprot:jgi/Psemu1/44455/gm1.44455_g
MSPGKRKTKVKPEDDDDYQEVIIMEVSDPDLSYLVINDQGEVEVEEEEKQPEARGRRPSGQYVKAKKKPPPGKPPQAAKKKDEESEEMEIEGEEDAQSNTDLPVVGFKKNTTTETP